MKLDLKAMLVKALTSLSTLLADSGWQHLGNNVYYRKVGVVVYVRLAGVSANSTNTSKATLPADAIPSVNITFTPRSGHTSCTCYIRSSDGAVVVSAPSTVSNVEGTVAYPVP